MSVIDRDKEFALDEYDNDNTFTDPASNRKRLSIRFAIIISVATLVFGYFFSYGALEVIDSYIYSHHNPSYTKQRSGVSRSVSDKGSSSTNSGHSFTSPDIIFYNNYTINRPLTEEYPWDNIVEPYRITYFEISNPISSSLLDSLTDSDPEKHSSTKAVYSYHWYVNGWHKDSGAVMKIAFTDPPGSILKIQVMLKHFNPITNQLEVISMSSIEVIVKYVRREIRSLFDKDREALFNAVSIMQRVPTQTGKKLYGEKYFSKDYFNRVHLYYGGQKECDNWHGGPGFVTAHITLEVMYEQSLQSINPSITIPYWDFTLESTFFTPYTFRSSKVFSEDWFGDAVCNNSLRTPMSGRFRYVPTMANAQNYSSVYSPYKLLKSMWNLDPVPYMTRSNTIYGLINNLKPSGCSEYHRSMAFFQWKGLAGQLNTNAHGHLHELMGGSWNRREVMLPDTDEGFKAAFSFIHAAQASSKILWRNGYLNCPTDCADVEQCRCSCVDFKKGLTKAHVLVKTGIIKTLVYFDKQGKKVDTWINATSGSYETIPGYTFQESQRMYDDIMNILCDPGAMGDMYQSTSTNDITFWVLHPTLDRLWHRMRLNSYYGLVKFDNTWENEEGMCKGHLSYALTPFKNIFDKDDRLYTNSELYDLLNPVEDSYPYVYDHFRWSHCDVLGYEMTGLQQNSKGSS